MEISVDAVVAMAPDEASVKAARGLVSPGKWPLLRADEEAGWGACQGSGSKPYQVKIERAGLVCSCSCPSRKIPCKHALALLLLLTQHPDLFTAPRPEWLEEWLDARRQRAAKQEARKESANTRAKASSGSDGKREQTRLLRMQDGLEELERWMGDQIRQGLSQLSEQYDVWDKLAARMVDAQAPGMAAQLRSLGKVGSGNAEQAGLLLGRLGRLQLMADAFRNRGRLSLPEQEDVRAALGFAPGKDEVMAGPDRVEDIWQVFGVTFAEEEKLWRRRVWLYGRESGRMALLLDFSHGNRQFERVFSPGESLHMVLAFYPGAAPLRAVSCGDIESAASDEQMVFPADCSFGAALERMARLRAANPWQEPLPLVFDGARLCRRGEDWMLLTDAGQGLSLDMTDAEAWELLAESGGQRLFVCGEWEDERLKIAGAFVRPAEEGGKA